MKNFLINILKKYHEHPIVMFIDQLYSRTIQNRLQASSAQLAYFTLLSLFPFMMILLNVLTRISILHPNSIQELLSYLPKDIQSVMNLVINDLQLGFGSNLQLTLAIFGGLYSASLGIRPMIQACNLAFDLEENKEGVKVILTSLFSVGGLIFLIIGLFIVKSIGDQVVKYVVTWLDLPNFLLTIWYTLSYLLTPLFLVGILYLLNRYSLTKAARTNIPKKYMLPGAVLSTVLMMALTSLFSYQINYSDKYAITYGSISGVIILIVWLYLMSTALVLGFEINGTLYSMSQVDYSTLKQDGQIAKFLSNEIKEKNEGSSSNDSSL